MSNLRNRAQGRDQTPATPGNGIAVQQHTPSRVDLINEQLTSRRGIIAESLGKVLDLDVFMGRVMAEFRKTPQLASCSLPSVMGAVVSMAQLQLEPGPLGHVYLTPRQISQKRDGGGWDKVWEAVLVVGYRGYIELGRRAGGMSIDADVVHAGDDFTHVRGTEELLTFRKALVGDRGPALGYWMAASFDGGQATHFMRMDELHEHAETHVGSWNKDRGPDDPPKYKGFAGQNWDGWCRKTVLRQAAWRLPQTVNLAKALARDEQTNLWQDGVGVVTVTPEGEFVADEQPAPPKPDAGPVGEDGMPVGYDPSMEPGYQGGQP